MLADDTPAAVLDLSRMRGNIARMQRHLDALGVRFRPHVKTSKCLPVIAAQREAGARGVTVSTLREAAETFGAGERDVLYAVGLAAAKARHVLDLRRQGCDLKVITDSLDTARELDAFGRRHDHRFEVWIEIDVDGHRSGIPPDDTARLLALGRALDAGGGTRLGGVLAHAGGSYGCDEPHALAAAAARERDGTVHSAMRLREAGLACPVVSIGSTPTALSATDLAGVTEVRAGVYVFFDLVMHNVGVCRLDEIALSVETTVIGHRPDRNWAIVDAGWMAMSRDHGTQSQRHDYGFGQICDAGGTPIDGLVLTALNQEHGIVAMTGPDGGGAGAGDTTGAADAAATGAGDAAATGAAMSATSAPDLRTLLPVGTRLRVLPNHACATATQFAGYHVVDAGRPAGFWPRFHGW